MNFKLLSLLVVLGLALGCAMNIDAKKGVKVANIATSLSHNQAFDKAASSLGAALTNQAEADIAYVTTDLYDLVATEALKHPELELPANMPIATNLLEKTDKTIYATLDFLKDGFNAVKHETIEKHPYMTAVIGLPIVAAGVMSVYLYNSENK